MVGDGGRSGGIDPRSLGSCCKGLADSMNDMPNALFRVEENGVLYLTVGYLMTENGPGWFDQAVLFCPFCGKQLQTEGEVRARAPRSFS